MTNKIVFQLDSIKNNCLNSIVCAGIFTHFSKRADYKLEKINDFLTGQEDKFVKIQLINTSYNEESLSLMINQYQDWINLKSFNYIISSLLIYIDEIILAFKMKEILNDKKLNEVIYNEKCFSDQKKLVDDVYLDIRKKTDIYKKLKKLTANNIIDEFTSNSICSMYRARNCIEHWNGYANPISFGGEQYIVSFPVFKAYEIDETGGKREIGAEIIISQDSKLSIEMLFEERTLNTKEPIKFSDYDIACFTKWCETLVNAIHRQVGTAFNKAV